MIADKLKSRKPNFFEYMLLLIGVVAIVMGYFFVQNLIARYGFFSFEATSVMILLFILVVLIILTAVSENSKEELKIIIKQQADELKFLREDMRRKR
jgi:ATP/ADP translocase